MLNKHAEVAKRTRQRLQEKNISSRTVGEAIGKSQATAHRKISGKIPITLNELHQIADLLDTSVNELLGTASAPGQAEGVAV